MRTYKKMIGGICVKAYNDSNCDWVVSVEGMESVQRFDKRKWTMKAAMQFAAKLAA